MVEVIVLDAGPLGMASHPRPTAEFLGWLAQVLAAGVEVLVPEIADYEVRRELLRAGRTKGVQRLDEIKASLGYLPITTEAMLKAAELWAEARRRGRPTARDESLDADVILAAQAATLHGKDVVVASTNPKHLTRFVPAAHWQDIQP
jgi:predicted nucleic acid-binding protein